MTHFRYKTIQSWDYPATVPKIFPLGRMPKGKPFKCKLANQPNEVIRFGHFDSFLSIFDVLIMMRNIKYKISAFLLLGWWAMLFWGFGRERLAHDFQKGRLGELGASRPSPSAWPPAPCGCPAPRRCPRTAAAAAPAPRRRWTAPRARVPNRKFFTDPLRERGGGSTPFFQKPITFFNLIIWTTSKSLPPRRSASD